MNEYEDIRHRQACGGSVYSYCSPCEIHVEALVVLPTSGNLHNFAVTPTVSSKGSEMITLSCSVSMQVQRGHAATFFGHDTGTGEVVQPDEIAQRIDDARDDRCIVM